jgi:hypothetical protein
VVKGTLASLTVFPDESLILSEECQRWMDNILERIKAWDSSRKRFVVSGKILGVVDPMRPGLIEVLADHTGDGSPFKGAVPSSDSDRPATREDFERFRVSITAYENDLEYKTPK